MFSFLNWVVMNNIVKLRKNQPTNITSEIFRYLWSLCQRVLDQDTEAEKLHRCCVMEKVQHV